MENEIKNYIEECIPELKDRLYPVFTTDISRMSVTYKFTPLSGGHLKQSQIELRIIDSDYDLCKEMEEKLTHLLDMESDESFVILNGVKFHSAVSGGGALFNDEVQLWEDTLYFIIDWREIHVI